jgi:hypothetical protein
MSVVRDTSEEDLGRLGWKGGREVLREPAV